MKINELHLRDFTAFEDARFEFSPGLNVLIGANATGKSHVLKAMYAVLKTWDDYARSDIREAHAGMSLESLIAPKLAAVFKPKNGMLKHLARMGKTRPRPLIKLSTSEGAFSVEILPSTKRGTIEGIPPKAAAAPCLFIPSREALGMYEGFQAAYANRELAFDETYYDISLALSAGILKQNRASWAKPILAELEQALDGPVQLKDGRFYIGELESLLVAEGHRKFAMLVQLIRNGSVEQKSALFWDEPESGLNPRLVKIVADVLLKLAGVGLQVFIATHDYLLTSELSIASEYETAVGKAAQTRFFCLGRQQPDASVEVQAGATLADIEENPILSEFSAHYEREKRLFYAVSSESPPRGSAR